MLFDPTPKKNKKELFDREEELKELQNANVPMVMVLGNRRVGKTSLVRVFMNETRYPSLFIDCRRFSATESRIEDFAEAIAEAFETLNKKRGTIEKLLKNVEEIEFLKVRIKLKSPDLKKSIIEVFERINELAERRRTFFYLIFDEAQNLRFFRRMHGIAFNEVFGYIYDSFSNVKIVLTGSEAGLLREFLGVEDEGSPLYGRYIKEIPLTPFSREDSLKFLELGFKEVGMEPRKEVLEMVVDELDGIVGWLVYFGRKCMDAGVINHDMIHEILKIAEGVVKAELDNIARLSIRYLAVLKVISMGASKWKEIKSGVEFLERKRITDAAISRSLEKLEKMGFIEKVSDSFGDKVYKIVDPIVARVCKEMRIG